MGENFDRRGALFGGSALLGAGLLPAPALAQAQTAPPVTQILARYIVNARFEDLPAAVRKEGTRSFLNWMGVAVGGSHHETIGNALAALTPFAGKPEANIMGRSRKARYSQCRAGQRHQLAHLRL